MFVTSNVIIKRYMKEHDVTNALNLFRTVKSNNKQYRSRSNWTNETIFHRVL